MTYGCYINSQWDMDSYICIYESTLDVVKPILTHKTIIIVVDYLWI